MTKRVVRELEKKVNAEWSTKMLKENNLEEDKWGQEGVRFSAKIVMSMKMCGEINLNNF